MTSVLIRNVRIFDGEAEIPNGSVLVEDGKIARVSGSQLEPPNTSTIVVSKPGHTLIPGLIDGHMHAQGGNPEALTVPLKFGVTTVCDMMNEAFHVKNLRVQAAADPQSADFKSASYGATIEDGWPGVVILALMDSPEARKGLETWPKLKTQADVDAWIQERVKDADYVKLFHEDGKTVKLKPKFPSLDLQKMVVKAAHDHNMVAVAHAMSLQSTIEILSCGVDGLAHTIADSMPTKELIDAYQRNDAHCCPTLVTIGAHTQEGHPDSLAYANDPRIQRFLSDKDKGVLCACMDFSENEPKVEYAYESVRMMKAAGIDVIVGTDATGGMPGIGYGISVHHEMALLVNKCGFTPAEALKSATQITAKRLRLGNRGRIVEGYRADLVLVEGNPVKNIDDTLNLRAVWKLGVLHPAYTL